jgi:signal transduction histidine kinase
MFRAARWRLVAWNVLVLTLILAILEIAVYRVVSANIYQEVDQQLSAQEQHLLTDLGQGLISLSSPFRTSSLEPSFRTVIANTAGQVNISSECSTPFFQVGPPCPPQAMDPTSKGAMRHVLESGRPDTRTVSFRGDWMRVRTFPVFDSGSLVGVIQISRTAGGEVSALHWLGLTLILGGLLGIALSGLAGLFLANKALVPIRQAFARQRQFTADASHELRTPLALIRANAEMLAMSGEQLSSSDGEMIGEIIRETDHLNRLVGDLLTLARADSESMKIETKPVDFRSLVQEVHEDVQRVAESQGIQSTVTVNGPVTVQGDEVRLRQLLLILLDNALKYTDPGGHVDVSLRREDGHARLVVADTGIGIPPEDLSRIFDRFYRVDRAREHESGGTGLGLAIARWIAQAHHGSIKVDSRLGSGSRFEVDLPAA